MEDHIKYMQACNKNGIRIYPVPVYRHYYLEIEYRNCPGEENRRVRGEIRYDPKKYLWCDKIKELYKYLYEKKIARVKTEKTTL